LVVGNWLSRRLARHVVIAAAVGIAVGVAASRVLLDLHWLSDVVGGLALGWAWFALVAVVFGGRLLIPTAATDAAAAEATSANGSPRVLGRGQQDAAVRSKALGTTRPDS
jgi:undecaprenyl-diphosphatase